MQTKAAGTVRVRSFTQPLFFQSLLDGLAELGRCRRGQGTEPIDWLPVPSHQDFCEVPFYVSLCRRVLSDQRLVE